MKRTQARFAWGIDEWDDHFKVDKAVRYPLSTSGDPCSGPLTISFRDSPGISRSGRKGWIKDLRQDFVVCVTCLSGREGYDIGAGELLGITTYDCVSWGHHIVVDVKTGKGKYYRYLEHLTSTAMHPNLTLPKGYIGGCPPMNNWMEGFDVPISW